MSAFSKLLNENHDPRIVEKLMRKVGGFLTIGEDVQCVAAQHRLLFNGAPDYVVLTYKRIIFCRVRDFGLSLELEDYQWKDVLETRFEQGWLGAKLRVKTARRTRKITYLPKKAHRELRQFVQDREAQAREYAQFPLWGSELPEPGAAQLTPTPPRAPEDLSVKMNQLEKMLKYRIINKDEFEERRDAMLVLC
ncbi:PH domain-containing protein [Hymenobacter sp. BT770]|uniref:PH domain-containing protein n=1 Tax=Hymenobacter sp. BT770 TaxID=2886942 RepID=UPI001D110327|nr:PH domain-containing protein [Hymenobacter sp. BT770]MCC3152894.1 PH domain-containing protein [Hymenobacter sp. BT770]MDO3414969.1 PH domain-containing protein [Hymenobacter sp. BT770]